MVAGIVVIAVAACGSSSAGSSAAANPTIDALSYFPTSAPFVMTVATAPQDASVKQAQTLERRDPQYQLAMTAILARLAATGINYNQDIRPLFGNPIALGAVGVKPATFLATWVTKSAPAATRLITKIGLQPAGSHDGAALYAGHGLAVGIDGSTVVISPSTQLVDSALDRHAAHQGFDNAAYAHATAGVAQGGVVEMFGDLSEVLAQPSAAPARQIPWVASIAGYAASVSASPTGVTMRFHLSTTGRPLSTSQLPIASGATAPDTAGDLPIQVAIRDPAQIIDFAEAAERATDPGSYAGFLRRQAAIKRRAGFDLNAFVGMLTGDLTIQSDTQSTMARAQVSNPAAVSRMLSRLAGARGAGVLGKGTRLAPLGDGLYAITSRKSVVEVGVIGDDLVVGRATPAQLRAYAASPATAASSGTGSVAFRIALAEVARLGMRSQPSAIEQQLLARLGDLVGSAGATTSGLSGIAHIALR
jgi:uncharacterized protein DUF3352